MIKRDRLAVVACAEKPTDSIQLAPVSCPHMGDWQTHLPISSIDLCLDIQIFKMFTIENLISNLGSTMGFHLNLNKCELLSPGSSLEDPSSGQISKTLIKVH